MTSFCEKFSDQRIVSWHPGDVDLEKVRNDEQLASFYRRNYKISFMGLQQLADCITYRPWAPIAWLEGRCLKVNFITSHWMVLDFDESPYTLQQALKDWCDTVHIIGTTKSHQLPKDDKDPKDRFRVIVPWEKPIECLNTYEFNISKLIKKYQADETCVDGARFFFPCREIVSVNFEGYLQPVLPYTPPEKIKVNSQYLLEQRRALFGKSLPRWISEFVKNGKMPPFPKLRGSRKWTCFAVCGALRDLGWSRPEIESLLHNAKFDRTEFKSEEIDAAIRSAFTKGSL